MTRRIRIRSFRFLVRGVLVGTVLGVMCAVAFGAESPLADAKTLYASASYEAALQALDRIEDATPSSEMLEYRALCLLALGRTTDAQKVTETLVTQSPMLVPSFEEFPPRFVTLVTEMRRRLLPALARRLFAQGRDQFLGDRKADAARQFEQVLVLANDPAIRDATDGADLRTLAMGYLDLMRAQTQSAPPVQAAAIPAAAPTRQPARRAPVTQAVVVRQTLPAWTVRTMTSGGEMKGAVRVTIGADGKVKSATIVTPVHPVYDSQVLAATRDWLYQPATLDRQPVESERLIEFRIQSH
jgi:TonB family protein